MEDRWRRSCRARSPPCRPGVSWRASSTTRSRERNRGNILKPGIAATFLELGDATSRNLEFSHRRNVSVSFGEETITEINLLEIRRRHPERVHVWTFTKAQEAKIGADWEWHIVGRERTAKMRVQAKRLQRNDVLKITHKVSSSGDQQRDLLLSGAQADGMKPIYCIYCTEPQRGIWTEITAPSGYRSYHTGCLLVDANDVSLATRRLHEIEDRCIPWHYLVERSAFVYDKQEFINENLDALVIRTYASIGLIPTPTDGDEWELARRRGWNAPTIDDLNEDTGRDFDGTGVAETTDEDRARLEAGTAAGRQIARQDQERAHARGVSRMMAIDVRDAEAEEGLPRRM